MNELLNNTRPLMKGTFQVDLLDKKGQVVDTLLHNNNIADWVNDYIMLGAFNTFFKKTHPSAITPSDGLFTTLFKSISFIYDEDKEVQANNTLYPKNITHFNVAPIQDMYQIYQTIEDGMRKTSLVVEVPAVNMNNIPVNGVMWTDGGNTTVAEPQKNLSNTYPITQINNVPSYMYRYYFNPNTETNPTWIAKGRYAMLQYKVGTAQKYRLLDLRAREVIYDSSTDIATINQFGKADHMFYVLGYLNGNNYLVNLRDGSVKIFNCLSATLPAAFTQNIVIPDEDGNLYQISSFNTSTLELTIKKWNLGDASTAVEDVIIDTNDIYKNLPELLDKAVSIPTFSGTGNFELVMIEGKPHIAVLSYNLLSGKTVQNIKPVFDLDCNLILGHIADLSNNTIHYWGGYVGTRMMGFASAGDVIDANTTEYRVYGGIVPYYAKSAVGYFPTVVKTEDQTMRLTYSFLVDCGDFAGKILTPWEGDIELSTDKEITSFILAGREGVIDDANGTINVIVPWNTDLTSLIPEIFHTGRSILPSGLQNFTNDVIYTVRAADNTIKEYTVTAVLGPKDLKEITTFELLDEAGVINNNTNKIDILIPYGTNKTNLEPTITHNGETIAPTGPQNYENTVTYTITAEDSSTRTYTVVVEDGPSYEKDIAYFELAGKEGDIIDVDAENGTIAVTVPYGTNVTALTPIITHVGETIKPTGVQNFTNPVTYTVTAEDGSEKEYIVTVAIALNSAKEITTFDLDDNEGVIVDVNTTTGTITVTVPYALDITNIAPHIIHTGASINPASDATQNFTTPKTYTVTAANNSTKTYTVTVTKAAPSTTKDITGFELSGADNVAIGANTIDVTFPADSDVTNLTPVVTHNGISYSPIGAQDFTTPQTYTVTAEDASTKNYTVTVTVEEE